MHALSSLVITINNIPWLRHGRLQVECDFIVKEGQKISAAYQVCSELNAENAEREVSGLIEAMKVFDLKKGYILTLSAEDEITRDGFKINVTPAWKWMLEGNEF